MKDQSFNIFIVITLKLVSFLSCVVFKAAIGSMNFMSIANNYYHYRSKEKNATTAWLKWIQHPSGEG